MAYSFDQVFAADPSNPANVARNAAVTIFAPGDVAKTPLTLTTPNGDPLPNPLQVNNNGFGSAFMHATLDRVAWAGGNFTGFFTSYEGMKAEAVSARQAATTAVTAAEAAITAATQPTDTAVESLISTTSSATRSALDAAISDLGGEQFVPQVRASNTRTATYTLTAADIPKAVEIDSASDTYVIVPSGGDIPVGAEIEVSRLGAGKVRIIPEIQNLLSNGSSESVLSMNPRGAAATPTRSTSSAYVGTYGVQSTSTSAASFGVFLGDAITLSTVGVAAGDKLSASIWFRCPADTFFRMRFMRAGQTVLEYVSPTTKNGIVKIENITVPEGATQVLLVTDTIATAAGQLLEIDAAILQVGTTVSAYQDGDTLGAAWSGTFQNSPSYGPALLGSTLNIPASSRVILRKRSATQWAVLTPTSTATATVALTDRDNGQAGMWAPSGSIISQATSGTLTANRLYMMRVCPSRPMVITKVGFKVVTASGTDDSVDVGILTSAGARLVSSGSVTGHLNSTGSKNVTVAATILAAGQVYYVSISANSTATLTFANTISDAFGSSMPAIDLCSKDASFPIPSTVAGVGVRDSGPLMWVRES